MRRWGRYLVLGGGFCLTASAFAGPTGLYIIPIADIQKLGQGFSYLGAAGETRTKYSWFNADEFGIGDRTEGGWDSDLAGHVVLNAKTSLLSSSHGAISAGFMNCSGSYSEPFVTGRYDLAHCRLHGGYWKEDGVNRMFIGSDFPINASWTGMVEHLSGPAGQTWLSAFYAVPHSGVGIDFALGANGENFSHLQQSVLVYYSFGA